MIDDSKQLNHMLNITKDTGLKRAWAYNSRGTCWYCGQSCTDIKWWSV